jgi:uncharacterized protein (DUF302 family)
MLESRNWLRPTNKCKLKEIIMPYSFNKKMSGSFEDAVNRVTDALKKEGFGVLTEIDVQKTLKKKLDVDFRKYKILGACNPNYAYQALQLERRIGTMLPCNVIVQETDQGDIEVAAIDPMASMQAVDNPDLGGVAIQVQAKLKQVVQSL